MGAVPCPFLGREGREGGEEQPLTRERWAGVVFWRETGLAGAEGVVRCDLGETREVRLVADAVWRARRGFEMFFGYENGCSSGPGLLLLC